MFHCEEDLKVWRFLTVVIYTIVGNKWQRHLLTSLDPKHKIKRVVNFLSSPLYSEGSTVLTLFVHGGGVNLPPPS